MTPLAFVLTIIAAGSVELRGGQVIDAPIVDVAIEGVRVGGDQPRTIGWDAVKRISGEHAAQAEPFLELADDAWRARLRLARGDLTLAEPLFEQLSDQLEGHGGPTALMVAEGLLRCRLRRGRQADAVGPWLAAARLRELGEQVAGDPPLRPVLDPVTLLAPGLPPVFLAGPEATRIAEAPSPTPGPRSPGSPGPPGPPDAPAAAALASLYQQAASLDGGRDVVIEPAAAIDHPGVRFVHACIAAGAPDSGTRAAAREALRDGLEADAGSWREAWRRFAIGRSLLMEDDDGQRTEGLFNLLHLPARFSNTQPYLAGIALAEASIELERIGNAEGAARLRDHLADVEPNHPVRLWLDLHDTDDQRAPSRAPENEP